MATHRQSGFSDDAGADPQSVTLASTPVEGNLLIATCSERSGGSASNHALTGITGWTHTISQTTEQSQGSYRRTLSVFWKVAGASESDTITLDDGTANSKWLTVDEFAPSGNDDQFVLLQSASNDNGQTDDATTIATGTTATVSEIRYLVATSMIKRNGGISIVTDNTWASNSLTTLSDGGASASAMGHGTAFAGTDEVDETKASTCTLTNNTENSGLNAAILVFSLEAAAGGTNQPRRRRQMASLIKNRKRRRN